MTGDAWLKPRWRTPCACSNSSAEPIFPWWRAPSIRWSDAKEETELWQQRYGYYSWLGAWTPRLYHPPDQLGDMPEGKPTTKPLDEDAAHFLVRMVRKYPHEVTIYAGGPMTNLALAISIDPEFPRLAKELVFMGASLSPQTDDPEFINTPRREFNIWFDPEAAHIVLRAPWKKIDLHHGGYFREDQNDDRADQPHQSRQLAGGAVHRKVCPPVGRIQLSLGRTGVGGLA